MRPDTWHQLSGEVRAGWRPVLVVIDEAADLLVQVRAEASRNANTLRFSRRQRG